MFIDDAKKVNTAIKILFLILIILNCYFIYVENNFIFNQLNTYTSELNSIFLSYCGLNYVFFSFNLLFGVYLIISIFIEKLNKFIYTIFKWFIIFYQISILATCSIMTYYLSFNQIIFGFCVSSISLISIFLINEVIKWFVKRKKVSLLLTIINSVLLLTSSICFFIIFHTNFSIVIFSFYFVMFLIVETFKLLEIFDIYLINYFME